MRIFLIGFMCSGKTTVGRALAPMLSLPFVDLDRAVEARVGPLLPYIQREGEEAFRVLEQEVLEEVIAGPPGVVATGGGTPTIGDNLRRMLATGMVLWLDVPMEVLMPRIERAGGDRPLLFGLKGDALRQRVETLFEGRVARYAEAHHVVPAEGDPQAVALRIQELLRAQPR